MKKLLLAYLFCFFSNIAFGQITTGSFSGVAYAKIPSGYRFTKYNGSISGTPNNSAIIYSPNRQYFLVYHGTAGANEAGRLVLYKAGSNQILWRSGSSGAGACVMQTDGNLVLYRVSIQVDADPSWSSNTHGNNGAFLVVQNDGNVVIYNSNNTRALWATGTNGR
ncbi:MAG: hypothetical protein MUC49_16795 [Raineya sp.]|jgi:hypothetical protein|nr:hypothetical protein [Raineya sp.]